VHGSRTITCTDTRGTKTYNFDQVLFQASQDDVYEVIGMPMVDNCMAGYNSSIFAYGQVRLGTCGHCGDRNHDISYCPLGLQTGAGKTFTMLGDLGSGQDPRSEQV
jgi:hypothetical protein